MKPHQRKHLPGRVKKENPPLDPNRPIFFYMPHEGIYGLFCQWHPTTFIVPTSSLAWLLTAHPKTKSSLPVFPEMQKESITFNCTEQFMMFAKALYFTDIPSGSKILASNSPKEQKALGKTIMNFDDHLWLQVCRRVVFEGNWWKFYNSTDSIEEGKMGYRDVLLGTGEREICEASRMDRRWGIGYNEKDALKYRNNWGANFLGKGLMLVREKMRERIGEIERGERTDWELPGEEMWDVGEED